LILGLECNVILFAYAQKKDYTKSTILPFPYIRHIHYICHHRLYYTLFREKHCAGCGKTLFKKIFLKSSSTD